MLKNFKNRLNCFEVIEKKCFIWKHLKFKSIFILLKRAFTTENRFRIRFTVFLIVIFVKIEDYDIIFCWKNFQVANHRIHLWKLPRIEQNTPNHDMGVPSPHLECHTSFFPHEKPTMNGNSRKKTQGLDSPVQTFHL